MSAVEAEQPVSLHIYEVGTHEPVFKAKRTYRIVGTGVFHVAVEVGSKEWSFAYCEATLRSRSGIFSEKPKDLDIHEYLESVSMPATKLVPQEVDALLTRLSDEWHGEEYDLLHRNCCHFSNAFCQALGIGPIPTWVADLAGAWATLHEQSSKAGKTLNNEDVITAAKAGLEVDAKYREGGTIKAKAVDLYRTGQQILDSGGANATQYLTAKKVACEAVEKEMALMKGLTVAAELYGDVLGLCEAAAASSPDGLAELCTTRSRFFEDAKKMLETPMKMPDVMPAEVEAVQLMQVRSRRLQPFARAKARLKNVQEGKDILEQGGDNATVQIVAKQVAKDAALTDKHLIERLPGVRKIYEDAVAKLASAKDVNSEEGKPLAELFVERVALYQTVAEMLLEPIESPTTSAAERDAASLISASDANPQARKTLINCTAINHGILYHGNLKKRGPAASFGWQDRWFVLYPMKLSFFADDSMRVHKGDVPITIRSRAIPFTSPSAVGESAKHASEKPYGFVLDSEPSAGKDRQLFYFDAPSDNEMKLWITAIEQAVESMKKPGVAGDFFG